MKCIECDKPNATHQCINCDSFIAKNVLKLKMEIVIVEVRI